VDIEDMFMLRSRRPFDTFPVRLTGGAVFGLILYGWIGNPSDCCHSSNEIVAMPVNVLPLPGSARPEEQVQALVDIRQLQEAYHPSGIRLDVEYGAGRVDTKINIQFTRSDIGCISGQTRDGSFVILVPFGGACLSHEFGHAFLGDWQRERTFPGYLRSELLIGVKLTLQQFGMRQRAFRCGAFNLVLGPDGSSESALLTSPAGAQPRSR
jgi:hypothetical protein